MRFIISQKIDPKVTTLDAVVNPSSATSTKIACSEFSTATIFFNGSAAGEIVFKVRIYDPFSGNWDYMQVAEPAGSGVVNYYDFTPDNVVLPGANSSIAIPIEIGDIQEFAVEIVSYTGTLSVGVVLSAGV